MDEKERDELLISIGKSLVTLARTHVLLLDMVKGIYHAEPMPDPDETNDNAIAEMEAELTEGYHETATSPFQKEMMEPIAPAAAAMEALTEKPLPPVEQPVRMHAWRKHDTGPTTCLYCGVEYGMQQSDFCRDGTTVKEGTQPHES